MLTRWNKVVGRRCYQLALVAIAVGCTRESASGSEAKNGGADSADEAPESSVPSSEDGGPHGDSSSSSDEPVPIVLIPPESEPSVEVTTPLVCTPVPVDLAVNVLAIYFNVSATMGSDLHSAGTRAMKWEPAVAAVLDFLEEPERPPLSASLTFFPSRPTEKTRRDASSVRQRRWPWRGD